MRFFLHKMGSPQEASYCWCTMTNQISFRTPLYACASAFQYLTSIQKPLSPSLPSNYDQITTTYFLSMSKCLPASAPFNVFEGTQLIFCNKNQTPSKVAAQYCFGSRLLAFCLVPKTLKHPYIILAI